VQIPFRRTSRPSSSRYHDRKFPTNVSCLSQPYKKSVFSHGAKQRMSEKYFFKINDLTKKTSWHGGCKPSRRNGE
jgi:hypothetical protein